MNLSIKKAEIAISAQRLSVKVAGLMFLFVFLVPTINWAFILSRFMVPDNATAAAKYIIESEFLFRIGFTIEIFMSVGLIILAVTLYIILKQVNKNLALLALSLKIVEATITTIIVLITFIALQIQNGEAYLSEFTPEQLQTPVGFLINIHNVLYSIPMIILGLDMMIFSYLFFRSKYIPRILAGFGIVSFALIFIHALMYIILPKYAEMPISQIIFWTPSGLFEIIIGIWLLIKGINVKQIEDNVEVA